MRDDVLRGRRAIVTGASSGIGVAVAKALAAAGATVVVHYSRGAEAAGAVVKEIEASGGRAFPLGADVSREAEVTRLFDEAREAMGGLDILVSNAGLQRDAKLLEMTLDDWNTVIGVNLTGQFLCARAAAREFVRQGKREGARSTGTILCMSSVHDVIPWAGHANYAASKGGILMLMKSMAQELAPLGIRVNGISPGAIKTRINHEAWATPEAEASLLKLIPYGRVGEPDDVARAAVWLASDDADYVTGATLYVDGGMTLYPGFADGG